MSKQPLIKSTSCAPSNTEIDSDSHRVNIAKLCTPQQSSSTKPCIYKVPPMLRESSKEAYTPQLLSIGPFHYKNNLLSSMKSAKEDCFEEILQQNSNIKDICEAETFKELKLDKIKHYYAEINFDEFPGDNHRDFFLMILRDACFIIKLFQMNDSIKRPDHCGSSNSDYDHKGLSKILNTPWLKKGIEQDLILLENQLPYFFLLHLYDKYFKQASPVKSFIELALDFFSIKSSLKEEQEKKVLHLTDLMRMSLIPTKKFKDFGTVSQYPCSATKLDTAGIEFVLAGEDTPLTQVKSRISTFSVYLPCLPSPKPLKFIFPKFEVRDDTVCILRNIIAFEQCHSNKPCEQCHSNQRCEQCHSNQPYVCSYVLLMHKLIKTKEDADLLMDKKIIRHFVGGEDVVELFDTLSRHIVIPKSYYASDCVRINKHYDNKWNRWMASFRRTYLKDVWTIGSTILGLVLFVLSVTLTIKSIFF